ncbi:CHC2 zinc finger domain-containing protein [Henriciella sp. AS95]|uniref:CHC2 zinc finger domain-containing protein n=1 Tax=Henriciella sp. AS95 TaxID=3135782 RepID=UPI00317F54F0
MEAKEITQALNHLTIECVGSFLGLELPAKGMARCPLPDHDDKTPSFEVRHHGRRWVCYACNKSGGAIDLVMACQHMEFLEAKQWLADKSGLLRSKSRTPPERRISNYRSQASHLGNGAVSKETTPDSEVYRALLARAPMRASGLDYLKNRKISEELIDQFSVGQMPATSLVQELVEEYGFERIRDSGLLTKKSTRERFWPILPPTSILFPFFESEKITYFQSRSIDDADQSNRWRNLNHRRRRLYNSDALRNKKVKRIAICEGVLDTLSSVQMGCEAIGFIGVSASLSKDDMISLRGKQVELFLDWDEAGDARASKLRKELARFGVAATRRTAPRSGATDVNALLCEGKTKI